MLSDWRSKVALGAIAMAFFAGVVGFAGIGEAEDLASLTAQSSGTVRESSTSSHRECRGKGSERRCWIDYMMRVTFEYDVGGRKLSAYGVGEPRSPWRTRDEATFEAKKVALAEGAPVTVFYDPNNPTLACIEPDDAATTLLLARCVVAFAGLLILASAVFAYLAVRATRGRRA